MTQTSERSTGPPRIGVLWRGDAAAPTPSPRSTHLSRVFEALASKGAETGPVIFADDDADRVRNQLLQLDGVVVWVDPIMRGVNRSVLDGLLREVASAGVYVSTHPDTILAMGTKDVLFLTRDMGWGTDTRRYSSANELHEKLPEALKGGTRVLKQHRGNGGKGVWRVELTTSHRSPATEMQLLVLHGARDSVVDAMSLEAFARTCEPYFTDGAAMIDQAFQSRLAEGMVRCYMAGDRVVGFGHQMVTSLLAPSEPGSQPPNPPARFYYGAEKAEFQPLRVRMESEWLPEMLRILDLDRTRLPAIWDADFLHKSPPEEKGATDGDESFVLCEVNVSSVYPMPDEAADPLADVAIAGSLSARAAR